MLRIMTNEGFGTPFFPILHKYQSPLIENKYLSSVVAAEK